MNAWRWTDTRQVWAWAAAVVAVIAIAAVVVFALGDDNETGSPLPPESSTTSTTPTTTTSTTTPTTTTTTTTPTTTSTTTTTSTSTTTAATTTTAPPPATTAPQPAVPGVVAVVSAGPGGGSGEVVLDWDAVANATGYRVLRSVTAGGPFEVVADLDVTTGSVSAAGGVVNIWSAQHSYVPPRGTFAGPDRSPWFQYVEVNGSGERCFQVIAYNTAGTGPASAVACGSPP